MKNLNCLEINLKSKTEKNRPRDKDTRNLSLFNHKKRNPEN